MVKFEWKKDIVPKVLKIKQVYWIIFDKSWKILLSEFKGKYSLNWWKPENNESLEETLKRELFEELNIEIEKPIFVWYQLVDEENEILPYAQVRMTALWKKIWEKRPDLDSKKNYNRIFVSKEKAIELLNWWEIWEKQIIDAFNMMFKK